MREQILRLLGGFCIGYGGGGLFLGESDYMAYVALFLAGATLLWASFELKED